MRDCSRVDLGTFKAGIAGRCSGEVGLDESAVAEVGDFEICPTEIAPLQVGAGEIGASQVNTPHVGVGEIGEAKIAPEVTTSIVLKPTLRIEVEPSYY